MKPSLSDILVINTGLTLPGPRAAQILRDRFPDLPDNPLAPEAHHMLREGFRQRTTADWVRWARQNDIPLEPASQSGSRQRR